MGRRGPCLDRAVRVKLYNEVKKLREKGYSYGVVTKTIEEEYGIRLSISVISGWCKGTHSPFNACRIPSIDLLDPSPELAYVIGVVCGDGYAIRKRKGGIRIGATAKDKEFIDRFAECLGQVLGREPPKPKPIEGGKFLVGVRSKVLYELLRKPIDIDRIRPFVESSEECVRSFLRGFFDSEGTVCKNGGICCYNADVGLLEYVQRLLGLLGIETIGPRLGKERGSTFYDEKSGKTYYRKKDNYYLYVKTSEGLKYYRLIGFTVMRRQQRLEESLRRRGLLMTSHLTTHHLHLSFPL